MPSRCATGCSPGRGEGGLSRSGARLFLPVLLIDDVGQLVAVVGRSRKVLRENLSHALDAAHDPFGEILAPEVILHLGGDFLPEVGAEPLVDAHVAQDLKLPQLRRDVEEDAIAFRRVRHAEQLEPPARGGLEVLGLAAVTWTRISPEVLRSASAIAATIRSESSREELAITSSPRSRPRRTSRPLPRIRQPPPSARPEAAAAPTAAPKAAGPSTIRLARKSSASCGQEAAR